MKLLHIGVSLIIITLAKAAVPQVYTDEEYYGSERKGHHGVPLRNLVLKSWYAELVGHKLRPIYNVAHMVNGDSQLSQEWVNSANAIESDLSFNSDGSPHRFHHGFPCDCGRHCNHENDPITHFATLRHKASSKSQTVALFWIDLKLSNSGITDFYSSGQKLAEVMTKRGSLFPPGEVVPMNVLLGAERTDQKEFFRGFRHHVSKWRPELLPKFGYDFSATSNDIDDMLNTFEELGIRENIWMGDGRTNCLPQSYSRLEKILARRDSGKSSRLAPSKVYSWTVDRKSTMRKLLQLGVDAIIVNHPDRMHSLVTDEFRDSLFLATRETDPWKHIKATNVAVPLAQGCSRWKSTCWKYVNRNNWCWTTATCNKSNDCWRNIHCS